MTELAALNVRITGDSGDFTAAVNSAKTQLSGLNTTIAQTQSKASGMGGALGGLASRFSGARGQIQNVSFQLQDMAVQLGSGTAASIVFAQQGSQIASAFGPVGAVVGALAAVGIPLLAAAFASGTEDLTAYTNALSELTAATEAFRVSAQAIRLGVDEEEVLIVERVSALTAEIARIEAERAQTSGRANQTLAFRITQLQAERAGVIATLQAYRSSRTEAEALAAASELSKMTADKMAAIMRQIANSNISGPWETVLGAIQAAITKAGEYARAAGVYGRIGARGDPRTMGALAGQTGTFNVENFAVPDSAGGGGAAANQLQSELEALQQGLMTQEQLQMESYTRQQETLQKALDARLLSQQDYVNLMQQVEATHQAKMGSQMREGVATTIGALSQLFNKSKPLAIASALVNTWQGMTEALKLPFPKNIAAAATTLATGMNAVRNIKSTSPGGGGSTSGSIGAGAAGVGGGAPQQNVQTLNFTLTNDSFGIGQNLIRQIAAQLNEASRNGSTLVRATVS